MELVASSEGVGIYCPSDGRISFFNSPYPAHHDYTAIDLYPRRLCGETAPSPVRGEVIKIRRVVCPIGRFFKGSSFDYVILIKSLENPDRLIKILHVAPSVKVEEVVELGQDLGVLLRSGYFNFWTEPHIHVEVRSLSDPLRARGGLKIERLTKIEETEPLRNIKGTVVEVKPEYFLISLDEAFNNGIPADAGVYKGILDAGLPHYGWIGMHTNDALPIGEDIKFCGKTIGTIKTVNHNMCLAKCFNFSFRLGDSQVGLSLYLHLSSKPMLKIVPPKPGAVKVERFEEVSLDIL